MSSGLSIKVDSSNIPADKMTSVYWLFDEGVYFPKTTELSRRRNLALTSKGFRLTLIQSVLPILEKFISDTDFNSKIEFASALRDLAVLRGDYGTLDIRMDVEAKILPLVQTTELAETYARYYEVRKVRNIFRKSSGQRMSQLVQTSSDKYNSLYSSLWGKIKDFDAQHSLRQITHRVRMMDGKERLGKEFYVTSPEAAERFFEEIIRPHMENREDVKTRLHEKYLLMGTGFLPSDIDTSDGEFVRNERAIVEHLKGSADPSNILEEIRAEEESQVSVEEAIAEQKRAALGKLSKTSGEAK